MTKAPQPYTAIATSATVLETVREIMRQAGHPPIVFLREYAPEYSGLMVLIPRPKDMSTLWQVFVVDARGRIELTPTGETFCAYQEYAAMSLPRQLDKVIAKVRRDKYFL